MREPVFIENGNSTNQSSNNFRIKKNYGFSTPKFEHSYNPYTPYVDSYQNLYEKMDKMNKAINKKASNPQLSSSSYRNSLSMNHVKGASKLARSEIFPTKTEESKEQKLSSLNQSIKNPNSNFYSGERFYRSSQEMNTNLVSQKIDSQPTVITNIQGNRNPVNSKLTRNSLQNPPPQQLFMKREPNRRFSNIPNYNGKAREYSLREKDNLKNEKIDAIKFSTKNILNPDQMNQQLNSNQEEQNSIMEFLNKLSYSKKKVT